MSIIFKALVVFFVFSLFIQTALAYPHYDSTKHYCGPEWLPTGVVPRFPAGVDFNPACYEHDKCYDECMTNCKGQFTCDADFEDDINAICAQNIPLLEEICYDEHPYVGWLICPALMINCNSWAARYKLAVMSLGLFSYECSSDDLEYCRQHRADNLNTGEGYYGTETTLPPSNLNPPDFFINHTQIHQYGGKLNSAKVTVYIENKGDVEGYAQIQLMDCYTSRLLGAKNLLVSANSIRGESFILEDLPVDGCASTQCVQISVSDGDFIRRSTHYVKVYSGAMNGRVVDADWNPVEGALVTLSGGEAELTQNDGTYNITGIKDSGSITITATHPNYGQGHQTINLVLNEYGSPSCDGLIVSLVDIRLTHDAASTSTTQTTISTTSTLPQTLFEIACNIGPYNYVLTEVKNATLFRGRERMDPIIPKHYSGISTAVFVSRTDIQPRTYTLEITKDGYEKLTQTLTLNQGQHKIINCDFDVASTTIKATTTTLQNENQRYRRILEE